MPPPMMSSARMVELSGFGAGADDVVMGAFAKESPSAAALRKMVRTSSSTERPFLAARSRSFFFSVSSSWRTVRLAIENPINSAVRLAYDCIETNAIIAVSAQPKWYVLGSSEQARGGAMREHLEV